MAMPRYSTVPGLFICDVKKFAAIASVESITPLC